MLLAPAPTDSDALRAVEESKRQDARHSQHDRAVGNLEINIFDPGWFVSCSGGSSVGSYGELRLGVCFMS